MGIITLASSKGGAGKTTLAQVIIGTVDRMGYSVGVVDADVNATLSDWLTGPAELDVECHLVKEESEIVPTAQGLADTKDLVIIDTAGGPSRGTIFAMGSSDLVLIPVQLSKGDVTEAVKTFATVRSTAALVKRKIECRILLTDYTPKTKIAKQVRKSLEKNALPTMRTRLHHLVAFRELTFSGKVPTKGRAGAQAQLLVQEMMDLECMGHAMKLAS